MTGDARRRQPQAKVNSDGDAASDISFFAWRWRGSRLNVSFQQPLENCGVDQ